MITFRCYKRAQNLSGHAAAATKGGKAIGCIASRIDVASSTIQHPPPAGWVFVLDSIANDLDAEMKQEVEWYNTPQHDKIQQLWIVHAAIRCREVISLRIEGNRYWTA